MGIQSAVHLLDDTSHAGDDRRKQTGRIGQGRCFQIFQGNVPDAQMTVVNHGGHEAGVILMYAEIEYNGQVHPGNVRDILQNGFIGGSMYQFAGNIRAYAFIIGQHLIIQGRRRIVLAVHGQKFCHNLVQRHSLTVLVIAGIQVDGRSNMGIPSGDA